MYLTTVQLYKKSKFSQSPIKIKNIQGNRAILLLCIALLSLIIEPQAWLEWSFDALCQQNKGYFCTEL